MEKISCSVIRKLCSLSKEEVDESFNIIFNKYRYLVYYVAFDILKDDEESKLLVKKKTKKRETLIMRNTEEWT